MLGSPSMRTASAVWRSSPELVLALDEQFGAPVDSYVNGSQTWLLDNGPGGVALEWRLHPGPPFPPPPPPSPHHPRGGGGGPPPSRRGPRAPPPRGRGRAPAPPWGGGAAVAPPRRRGE